MKNKKSIVLIILIPLILAALAGGGFLMYNQMQGQHAENLKDLEKFGFTVLPTSTHSETIGELGAKQLPSTFYESKATPTQKVIKGLMADNEQLIEEQKELRAEIETLQEKIASLQTYKELNEHFAPLSMAEEITAVERQLKRLLLDMPDARRFSNLKIEAMSAAAGHEYKKFIGAKRLILAENEREMLIRDYMPEFAFCVGDGIDIAANSPREERLITIFFRKQDPTVLPSNLKADLDTVVKPCQTALYERLSNYDKPI
ncbi:hypothetical protein [Neptuniibacter marinus]|uniref:hypothetical protein n=1 Tax=Neptuniibacter marinus TaxID=1806670 RepID=UPI003B5BD414